jgi:ankyrin repeat protein
LHYAVRFRAPVEVVQLLVDAFPQAVRVQGDGGKLPLHLAAEESSLEVVKVLTETWEPALLQKDGIGRLPLHRFALREDGPLEVLQYLVDKRPLSLQERDIHGELPLHLAVCFGLVAAVRTLGDAWEPALRVGNTDGELPLHVAAGRDDAPEELIRYLVDKFPCALEQKDA